MSAQLAFTDRLYVAPIQTRFDRYHAEHPWVYRRIVALARICAQRGERRGMHWIFEQIRYSEAKLPTADAGWKLNDQYSSRYARLVMLQEPDLADYFEVRELRSGR